MILSLLVLTVGLVAAQDTYSCPDGWMKEVNKTNQNYSENLAQKITWMKEVATKPKKHMKNMTQNIIKTNTKTHMPVPDGWMKEVNKTVTKF